MTTRKFRAALAASQLFALPASAAVVNATYNSPSDVPVSAASYTATGNTVNFTLNYAPVIGANLTVVNNTGLPFIQGTFDNLSQGQKVALTYAGITYNFVANYYGGDGNDLVLQWANTRAVAWGWNGSGCLGDGTTTQRLIPTAVRSTGALLGKTVINVAVGTGHSLALCSDGTLAAWGNNFRGQLGNDSITNSSVPVLVTQSGVLAGKTVVAVAAGYDHSLALCSDGTVAAWGHNDYGELGNNSTSNSLVPTLVSTTSALSGKSVIKIAAGTKFSLALCSDGTMAAWGYNGDGELGNNSTTNSLVAMAVSTAGVLSGKSVSAITAGHRFCVVATVDGKAFSWGSGGYKLGTDTSLFQSTIPVAVSMTGPLSGNSVTAVAGGSYHSLALCSDGTMASWGENGSGELGNNSTQPAQTPGSIQITSILVGKTPVGISVGDSHSLAICSDGTLAAWGGNGSGQLGNGSTTTSLAPTAVSTSPLAAGERFVAVVSGILSNHNLGIVASPSLPVVTTSAATLLTSSTATLNGTVNANSNSSSVSFNYGLTASYGSSIAAVPTPITGNVDTAVSANITGLTSATTYHYRVVATNAVGTTTGTDMTFFVASNNANLSGLALGSGTLAPTFSSTTTEYTASVPNTTTTMTIKPTLADTTASVRVNGIVVSSGSFSGAINLVVGPNVISTVVTAQDTVTIKTYNVTVTRLSANADLAALTTSAGSYSPTFDSATTSYTLTVPYGVTGLQMTPTVADNTATVKVNGTSVISGSPSGTISLSVGSNTITVLVTAQNAGTKTYTLVVTRQPLVTTYNAASDVPVTVSSLTATGNTANFALNYAPTPGTNLTVVNNTGMSFITGTFSNLAHGQTVALSFGGVTYNFVANYYGGTGNDLVLQWANSRSLAWGSNGNGQLGTNGFLDSAVPVPVGRTGLLSTKTLLSQASGGNHSVALCSDGTVATWGNNSYGQLGNNSTTDSLIPVSVTTTGVLLSKTVVAIAAGQYHNLALCSDGTLAAWGYNFYGQLGNGGTTQSSAPVAVSKTGVLSGKTVIAIAAGTYHSFALCSDGTLAAWGYNGNGELGNGGTGYSVLPVTVDNSGVLAGKTISSVIAGSFHNFALCADGTLVGWGYNAYGQLGNGNTNNSTVPSLVSLTGALTGKTVVAAAAGYYHTLALCSDGTVATWGYNADGELGNGNTTSSVVPVPVSVSGVLAGKSIIGVSAGAVHSMVLCSDGSIATWGYNGDGELGNNSASASSVPVSVTTSALLAGESFVAARSGPTSLHSLALVASPPLPVVTTLAATAITPTSAVLNGSINPNGTTTTPTFDYGLTTAYGTSLTGTPATVTGTGSTAVSAALTGLAAGTTYHYRLSGNSTGGTTYSADAIFTTAGYNANLSGLTLSGGPLSPAFASAVTSYTANVPSTTTSTTVTPSVSSPTSTVKVNGAAVTSGTASMPIFLAPGLTTITVVVTAQDGVTQKTYTVAVTRLLPAAEIQVEYAGISIADGGAKDFGYASPGRSSDITFTIKNIGTADLTGLGVTTDGTDAAMFTVTTAPVTSVPGPSGSTTFTVNFLAPSAGAKNAALHIVSNDSDESPYDINLTGLGLSSITDTDGDGLNDAAEFQMEALGFNWQVTQTPLVTTYYANTGISGVSGGQGLHLDAPKLIKNPSTGLFTLQISIQKSTDLLHFVPFPMTAPNTSITGDGKLEFEFASPDNAAFYRLLAE